MNNSKLLIISILTILLLGLVGLLIIIQEENSKSTGTHNPISIDGNEALATFIKDEGLSGDGTIVSPYIIENFTIYTDISHFTGWYVYGINIRSTDAYLIIQNCTIERGMDDYSHGIHLDNATNVNISNNLLNNNDYGIYLRDSSSNTLSGNNASHNDEYGIILVSSSNNMLSGNTANNHNSDGIYLRESSNNTLSGNTANNNYDGIKLRESSNNTLSGNTANNNIIAGIYLYKSSNNNTLSGNTASYNNRRGIFLRESSNNNTLSGNIISYNNDYGIILYSSSTTNTIYFNDIYGNTIGQAFEEDDCTDNHWDNGTTGNYWGVDYINNYPSATNDGTIWNIPYEISGDGSGIDHFPLVNSTTTYDATSEAVPGRETFLISKALIT
ncbi:MAG: right-handed parallel beta-helix repeat-containing protein [Candidatus Hodarchaeales archaeon]